MSREVAIVGAGPSGLAAARWLLARGFEPLILETAAGLGGQWRQDNLLSGVWPDMRTNTSRVVTRFSDLDYPPGTAVFPHNREVLAHLEAYAARFGLFKRLRTNAEARRLERAEGGWRLVWREDGEAREQVFPRVVVASGRFNTSWAPEVPGLDSFTGEIVHTFDYPGPEAFRGRRVLVAGGAISALEVACDMAMAGAQVTVAGRRQRYVVPKISGGVPIDSRFSRYGATAGETLHPDELARRLKVWILRHGGDPGRHGAPPSADDPREAGVALSQYFLGLLAEGRITARPWMTRIDGERIAFADGHAAPFDAIVWGTGFELRIPFLSDELRRTLDLDGQHIDLADFTFHPELEGLACYFRPPVWALALLWLAAAITVWTGVEYALAARKALKA